MQKTVKNLCGPTFTKRLKCEAADNAMRGEKERGEEKGKIF